MTNAPTQPRRIQLSRRKGWRLPTNTVVVARPSKWGNPFTIEVAHKLHPDERPKMLRARVVRAFASYANDMAPLIRQELAGKNLACWCSLNEPCHADLLLRLANEKGKT